MTYIRGDIETTTEVLITKCTGQFTIQEDGENWKEGVTVLCKILGEEKELRKHLSKMGGLSMSKAEVCSLAHSKQLNTVYVEGKELTKTPATPGITVFRATMQKEAIVYWQWVETNLGTGACPQSSVESRSEIVRAILGMAWLQSETTKLEWAGDMTIVYEHLQK